MISVRGNINYVTAEKGWKSRTASDKNVWNAFDRIYCIHYLPYSDRKKSICSELKRVGILDTGNFEWFYTTPNKYYDHIFYGDTSWIDTGYVNITNLNYTVNSYNLLCNIYELGYERVLILEDDIRFLKDVDTLHSYIRKCPLDYDLVMMEYFIWNKEKDFAAAYENMMKNTKINDSYVEFSRETVFDTGMFMLSRKMIKHMIDNDNLKMMPFDGYTRWQFTEDDHLLKRSVSNINLCVQRVTGETQDPFMDTEKYSFVDMGKYNV